MNVRPYSHIQNLTLIILRKIIGDLNSAIQTWRMTKISNEHAMMSSMGELTFFLGLQVQQKEDGIFISQDKYVAEILKKFDFATVKTASTPIETNKALVKDEEAEAVDVHLYRSMIGSLMYLTASRPDIMFAVCACARDSPFDLEAFSDSDYAGASLDRKSTTGGCQFLRRRLISWQCKKQTIVANSTTEAEYVAAANCCGQVLWIQNQMLDYGFNFMNTKIYIDNESTIYETVYKEWEDKIERAATTVSSLEVEQDNGNINRTQSMTTLNKSFPQGNVQSNDPPLSRVNTLESGEDRMQLHELMNLCTKLSNRVLTLETTKTTQALEIASLKSRVKKLEKKASKRTHKFKRLYKVGSTRRVESLNDEGLGAQEDASQQGRSIEDIDKDAEVSLVDETHGRSDDTEMFDTDALIVSTAAPSTIAVSPPVITEVEITLAQTLAELKSDPTHYFNFTSSIFGAQRRSREGGASHHWPVKAVKRSWRLAQERGESIEMIKETDEHEEAEEDDKVEMKKHMEIVQDKEEIAIDAIPLATKPPMIVEYKIVKEGQKGFFT
ncbi:putative ribonuclease H-like domain-containing protein [Tanacetum coccineum]